MCLVLSILSFVCCCASFPITLLLSVTTDHVLLYFSIIRIYSISTGLMIMGTSFNEFNANNVVSGLFVS